MGKGWLDLLGIVSSILVLRSAVDGWVDFVAGGLALAIVLLSGVGVNVREVLLFAFRRDFALLTGFRVVLLNLTVASVGVVGCFFFLFLNDFLLLRLLMLLLVGPPWVLLQVFEAEHIGVLLHDLLL